MRKLLGSILVCGLIASSAAADVLSTLTLPSSGADIAFGIYGAGGGDGSVYSIPNSVAGTLYTAPLHDVSFWSMMVRNPAAYTAHGPLWIQAQFGDLTWVSIYDTISYSHTDTGFGGVHTCCATIDGTEAVLTTPWKAVTLVRSPSLLTVKIYDVEVPEPQSWWIALAGLAVAISSRRSR